MKQQQLFSHLLSHLLRSLAIILALLLFLWLGTAAQAAITITVTTTSDAEAVDGDCSLREAIKAANSNATVNECIHDGSPGTDTIAFNIPGTGPHTIQPASALPAITEAVIIDGTTQPGAAANTQTVGSDATLLIELDGSTAAGTVSGLTLEANDSIIRGLVINRFSSAGIFLTGSNNTIEGNYIGTDVTGMLDRGNSVDGIIGGSPGTNNTIGGSTPAARNILSGNNRNGITLDQVNGYYIYGNYIGPDATGAADLGNTGAGIGNFQGSNHQIGGTSAGQGNVISGNGTNGVEINGSSAQNNSVQGNFIGTTADGTASLENSQSGVALVGSTSNHTIGGTTAAARNLISGNSKWGVFLSVGVNNNFIQGNYIGTDVTGQADLGNGQSGVEMQNAPDNTIGGTTAGAGNLISGNLISGVFINQSLATGNTVQGNLIGTDSEGDDALPNGSSGISLNTANNTIGGTDPNAGNLISGNNLEGIFMSGTNATGNTIQGNRIGTDITGTAPVGNGQYGIRVYNGPSNNTIGGMSASARNLVSGNLFGGISLEGTDTAANTINGNTIGADITGSADLGNGFTGIGFLSTGSGHVVGETDGGSNLIAFNGTQGVYISGSSPAIQANTIRDNGRSGISVVVDYGTDRSPATAADDRIARPLLGSPDDLNDIDNNCADALADTDCAGILLLDTAPVNAATLESDNNIGDNNGRNDVEQRWYGALEIINAESPIAASAVISSSNGGPEYTMDQSDACIDGLLDNTTIHGSSLFIDCDDVSTWTKFLEFIVSPTGSRETYTPHTIEEVAYSFDGDAATDPTDSGNGFFGEGLTTGPFSRYQIMELEIQMPPFDITLVSGSDSSNITQIGQTFRATAPGATLGVDLVTAALSSGDVIIDTQGGDSGSEAGNISLEATLDFDGLPLARTLTFSAANDITIYEPITDTNLATADTLNLGLEGNADGLDDGFNAGSVQVYEALWSGGGSIDISGDGDSSVEGDEGIRISATVNSGGGDLTLTGDGVGQDGIFVSTGSLRSEGGHITLTATGQDDAAMVLNGPVLSGGGDITMQGSGSNYVGIGLNETVNAAGGNITITGSDNGSDDVQVDGTLDAGSGDITLTGDRLNLTWATLSGSGNLLLQPETPGVNLTLGGSGNASLTFLNSAELATLSDGFAQITIGRSDGSGTISTKAYLSFTDPVVIQAPLGAIHATHDISGIDEATLTLLAKQDIDATDLSTDGNPLRVTSTDGNIIAKTIDARGSTGSGDVELTANFVRLTGLFDTNYSLRADGVVTITHTGDGITPFIVGDAAVNGTAGRIGTDLAELTPTQSFLFSFTSTPPSIFIVTGGEPPQTGPIFTVNTTADTDDGLCSVSDCSLREAIAAANATANGSDPDEIHFDLDGSGVQTILPNSPLPALTEAVIIDGLTQSGAACTAWPPTLTVELDGTNAAEAVGLQLTADGSTVRGLVINNFFGSGLVIDGDYNTVRCNFIGVDADGTTDQGNAGSGLVIDGHDNLIGGPASENGNLIAYNGGNGITVSAGTGNALRRNRLLANEGLGIDLADDGVTDNDLDDADSGPNNLQNYPVLYRAVPGGGSVILEGRLNGAANTTYDLDVFLNAVCDPSTFGEGETFLGSGSVTTGAEGDVFFNETLPVAVPTNQYVTVTATDPDGNTSELSSCTITGPDNDSWPRALTLSGNPATFEQFIDQPDQARWFKFSVTPNSRVQITLSNLPDDYDLLIFKDIAQAFEALNSSEDLQRLGAEFAPDAFSPSSFSPSSFSPSSFSPSSFSPSSFSPSSFSPSSFSPSSFSPSSFSPSSFSPSSFSPSSFSPSSFSPSSFSPSSFSPSSFSPSSFSPSSFSSAQTRSIIGASAFEGTSDETITVDTWNNSGDFYIRVRGKNGIFNLSNPFQIEVTTLETRCDPLPAFPGTSLAATAGDYETIIIVDESRLERMDGTEAEKTAMLARLQDLAAHPAVNGVVVNVGPDARVSATNVTADDQFACPYAKNMVADAIKEIIDAYRDLNPLQYIVIIGDDDIIPFYRYPDNALLGNEENYVPPVRDDTPSQASLRLGYILSQEQYGAEFSISVKGNDLPVPNLAVGRLVETATEITGMLDAFIDETNNGVVDTPTSSLVTGYDFLEDAALAVQDQLEAGIGEPADTLIVDQNLSPLDPAAWTATDLGNLLLNNRYDISFLAGHFSANSALAADYSTSLITTDLTNSPVDMTNALFFSAGCHAGYNIVNPHGIPGLTFQPDWAQAFAQKRATLIAGTGYQYGDTDFIEYGERLYLEFSRQLRVGSGPVPIGQALVKAKQLYLETTPQLRGLHEKTVLQTTIFGLPMLSVDLPTGRITMPSDSSIVTGLSAFPTDPGNTLGLEYADITIVPSFTTNTLELDDVDNNTTVTATYLSGSNGLVTNAAEPALPLEIRNVTAPNGKVLRGFAFRGGDYTDLLEIIPLTGAPTTEIRGVHTPFVSDVFYPIRPYNANYFGALFDTASGATRLVVTPAQFRSTAPGSQTNTLRRFDQMDFRLYYSDNTTTYDDDGVPTTNPDNDDSTPALAAPPAISQIQGIPDGNDIDFSAVVVGNPAAGIQEVWVTYTAVSGPLAGEWQSLDLAQNSDDSTRWEKTLTLSGTPPEDIRYIVQAVNGVGLVTLMDNLGAFYIPMVPLASQAEPPAPTDLALESPPTSGDYSTETTITARLTSDGTPVANQPLTFGLGQQTRVAFTGDDGRATVNIPLLLLPGSYSLKATFLGTADFAPASDQAPFAVVKQGTSLSLETPTGPDAPLVIATLTDDDGRPLLEQTIIFVVNGPNGSYSETVITNLVGQAVLTDIPLPGGTYTVTAYFNGEIPLPNGTTRLANSSYNPTTASTELMLAETTGSLTIVKTVVMSDFVHDFRFDGDLGVFTLTTNSAFSQTTFTDLAPNSYTISEDVASFPDAHWSLISVACVDTAPAEPQPVTPTVDDYAATATIPVAAGQQVVCEFLNERANLSGEDPTHQLYLPFVVKE